MLSTKRGVLSTKRGLLSTKRGLFFLVFQIAVFSACSKKNEGPPPRFAVLRIENLTGNPALDWAGRGVSESLWRMLDGAISGVVVGTPALNRVNATLGKRAPGAPGVSSERAGAMGASANHAITGYLESAGAGLRLVLADEDMSLQTTPRLISVYGRTVLDVVASAARGLAEKPHPAPTTSEEALRVWVQGLEKSGPQEVAQYQLAVARDPDFGPAWVSLVNATAQLDRTAAIGLLEKASMRALPPLDRAALEVERADLSGNRASRLQALRAYSALSPGDVLLLRNVAEQESFSGNFAAAAADYRKTVAILPADVASLNQAGYNFAWAGNYDEAVRALREYALLRPSEANPVDSLGDVNYWFGRYKEAAANYAAAHAKDPQMLSGGNLYKAAWAQFRSGDTKSADALFNQFLKSQEASQNSAISVVQGDWLYRSGRPKEALELLRKASDAAREPAAKAMLSVEMAILQLAEGDRAAALRSLQVSGPLNIPSLMTVRFCLLPSAPAGEWESRAQRLFAQPQLNALRAVALGWALILDGRKDAAVSVWEKIVEDSPATDFFARAVLARLKGEKLKHLAPPDPRTLNQFEAVLDRLETSTSK